MLNAKDELIRIIGTPVKLKCASLTYGQDPRWYPDGDHRTIILPVNYTDEEILSFIERMDFDYGSSHYDLYGTVWLKDGSWLTPSKAPARHNAGCLTSISAGRGKT